MGEPVKVMVNWARREKAIAERLTQIAELQRQTKQADVEEIPLPGAP